MKVVEVLHMNGGNRDISYANNSLVQRKVILMTKTIAEQAISDLYCSLFPKTLCIADLGCSSGANTFLVVSELVKIVEKERKIHNLQSPEILFHFNDLPGNDFNTIFQSLGKFQQDLRKQIGEEFGPCFFSGVPGSFYTRLFPSKSLHFVHSSYSLMWLSQGLIEEEKVDSFNIPQYTPSPAEVKYIVEKEDSFTINRLEVTRVHWNVSNEGINGGYNVSRCMRAVAEPLLVSQFDQKLMDLVFQKYEEIISDRMSKEKTEFINVIVSLTKKR
ncbi:hypothetical protein RND71_022491 [Anisodus tanguticus]|uniref:Uncharacterized protein n=1 Tax=Anisodus tanguticus TaxID=243964 RepID=A0AAE1RS65_9SOLA|nr:hypothetical protein RND71_022491 [Anisodus tanguticus]